ncbi:MAG: class I lanthipeptide [Bacteroidia bacterium]|nr:class I lanthipeptide [Bacteroidia bacterium]
MKEEKTKLVLNKRTIAHLNNLEMRHVRGGDGGDGDVSRTGCGDDVEKKIIIEELKKLLISFVVKVC